MSMFMAARYEYGVMMPDRRSGFLVKRADTTIKVRHSIHRGVYLKWLQNLKCYRNGSRKFKTDLRRRVLNSDLINRD